MRLKKSTRKFLFFILYSLFLTLFFIDFTPSFITKIWVRFPKLDKLRLLTKSLDIFYFPFLLPQSSIDQYALNIKPDDLLQLIDSLPQSYTFTIYDRNMQKTVSATFVHHTQALPVKVRIHGDLYPHWSGQKKSLRLRFNQKPFKGVSEHSFILPETRNFYIESLASYRAQKLGLIVLDNYFANLAINGQPQGIYFVQESWTKDILEKNSRSSDADLFGELDLTGVWAWPQLFKNLDAWKKYTASPQAPYDFASIDQLLKALEQNFDPGLIFDLDSFAKWQAHSMLFPSFHQDDGHNIRLYFNPSSGLFEFIPFDLELNPPSKDFDQVKYNQLVTKLLENPQIKAKRDQVLVGYVSNEQNLKDDLKYLDALFLKTRFSFAKDKNKAYSTLNYSVEYFKSRYNLIRQFNNIKKIYDI